VKKNLFAMGANFEEGWSSDNKEKPPKKSSTEIRPPQLKTLKKKLGTGGTVKDESLEFQGDIPALLRTHLEALGYRFKN
jgi:translation initiation factor 1